MIQQTPFSFFIYFLLIFGSGSPAFGFRCKIDRPLTPELRKLLQVSHANDYFDARLLDVLEDERPGENVFISAFSVGSTLAMIMSGGLNATATEIYQTLGFSRSNYTQLHILEGYQKLLNELNQPPITTDSTLKVANSIAIQKNRDIQTSFMDQISNYFGSQLIVEDFTRNNLKATDDLNAWVRAKTGGAVDPFIDGAPLSVDTVMVLLNAVYFKGEWDYKFDTGHTRSGTFQVSDNRTETVDFMVRQGYAHWADFSDAELLEIPYKNHTLSMYVLLPKPGRTRDLSVLLSETSIEERISSLQTCEVLIHLPRFKLRASYSLDSTLTKLGIKAAFGVGADFTPINGHRDLYVSEVLHRSVIEVNEDGSKATAVTGVGFAPKCMPIPAPPPIDFFVNRPFLFFIRDAQHHLTLFSGIINKPEY